MICIYFEGGVCRCFKLISYRKCRLVGYGRYLLVVVEMYVLKEYNNNNNDDDDGGDDGIVATRRNY